MMPNLRKKRDRAGASVAELKKNQETRRAMLFAPSFIPQRKSSLLSLLQHPHREFINNLKFNVPYLWVIQ
jgi:hypothetical protein